MSGNSGKKQSMEVESDQLRGELIEIKERLGALETIASISNRAEVERFVRAQVTNSQRREILSECEEPRTREHLIKKLNYNSPAALDYHLAPLREANLVRPHFEDNRTQTFEWSNLFKRLPKSVIKEILNDTNGPKKTGAKRNGNVKA